MSRAEAQSSSKPEFHLKDLKEESYEIICKTWVCLRQELRVERDCNFKKRLRFCQNTVRFCFRL